MKQFFLFLVAIALPSCMQNPFLSRADAIRELGGGQPLSYAEAIRSDGLWGTFRGELFGSPQSVSFVRFRPGAYTLNVVSAEGPAADSTSTLCLQHEAVAGINGSYFDMQQLTSVTYLKDDGFVVNASTSQEELFRTNGAVLLGNGIIRIDAAGTSPWDGWREVMASGPILLDEGVRAAYTEGISGWEDFYAKRHPRSMIGTDGEGSVWLVVVDGRAEGQATGMSISELTELAHLMGLTDALNLDGGGSSTLWTLSGGVVNHPCDNGKFDADGQRVVPSILALQPVSIGPEK